MSSVQQLLRHAVTAAIFPAQTSTGRAEQERAGGDHFTLKGPSGITERLGSGVEEAIQSLQTLVTALGGEPISADQLRARILSGLISAIDAQPPVIAGRDPVVTALESALAAHVIGQHELREQLLVALLTGGHLLLEGVPGGGKTHAIKVLRSAIQGEHSRVQLTPGTTIEELTGVFDANLNRFSPGGLFGQIVHLDEVNRTKQKIQAAFMQAMAEGEITVDGRTFAMPEGFIVFATQNPAGDVGTFPLSPAMLDRFQASFELRNGSSEEQKAIALKNRLSPNGGSLPEANLSMADVVAVRAKVAAVHIPDELQDYAIALKDADPKKERVAEVGNRGLEALYAVAQALAYIDGRNVVSEADLRKALPSVLRHRIELTFEAQNAGRTVDAFVRDVLESVPVPNPSAP